MLDTYCNPVARTRSRVNGYVHSGESDGVCEVGPLTTHDCAGRGRGRRVRHAGGERHGERDSQMLAARPKSHLNLPTVGKRDAVPIAVAYYAGVGKAQAGHLRT